MGCDITSYVEIKKDDKWMIRGEYFQNLDEEFPCEFLFYGFRDYELFGVLAGVRSCYYEPISMPKGLPDDVSYIVRKESCEFQDYFDHSYFTLKELLANMIIFRKINYMFVNEVHKLREMALKYKLNFNDVRIVFWFDN
jgi:hypothetical protein